MTTTNVYFSHGTRNEQYLVEDLIIESLKIYGNEMFYIPRTLVAKDDILGEDRLSEFKHLYPIEMYFENVDSFDGQGAFIQKFGLMMEQSATLVVSRRRWEQMIGRFGQTTIPTRPNEGDLIYFPLTKGLFEIKFVKHQDPFYQLGKLYVYKLQVELFQYASERIDTGVAEVDVFESLKTFSTNTTRNKTGMVVSVDVIDGGSNYSGVAVVFTSDTGTGAAGTATVEDGVITGVTITNGGVGYETAPTITFTANAGSGAEASANIDIDIDKANSYGDNNSFKQAAANIVFSENNPFGDADTVGMNIITYTADNTSVSADSTTITADTQ